MRAPSPSPRARARARVARRASARRRLPRAVFFISENSENGGGSLPPPSPRLARLFFVSFVVVVVAQHKPLHVAAWGQHVAIVRRLAAAGALLDARNGGRDGAYVAAEYNRADAVGALSARARARPSPTTAGGRRGAARAQGHAALADRLGAAAADFARDKPGGFRKPRPAGARRARAVTTRARPRL